MSESRSIPVKQLRESPFNPRKHFGSLDELVASIKSVGIVSPLLARPVGDALELVAGHRRLRAAKVAGLREVPVVVRELDDAQALEIQLIENVQREDIHPMEEAEAYGRLHTEFGHHVDEIAKRVGKARATVYGRMKLLELAPEVRKAFYAGVVNAANAERIARLAGERLQLEALRRVTTSSGDAMGAREGARVLKELTHERPPAKKASAYLTRKREAKQLQSYALRRVVEVVERRSDFSATDLRLVLQGLLEEGVPSSVLERRGVDSEKQLEGRVQKASSAELRGLLVELALTGWVEADAGDTRIKAVTKAFSLDYRELERTSRELAEKQANEGAAEALFTKRG